jgi:hypothetical protein
LHRGHGFDFGIVDTGVERFKAVAQLLGVELDVVCDVVALLDDVDCPAFERIISVNPRLKPTLPVK